METQNIKASAVWINTQTCKVEKMSKTKAVPIINDEGDRLVVSGKNNLIKLNGCEIKTDMQGRLYLNNEKTIFQLR
jgi:hypothetical protein